MKRYRVELQRRAKRQFFAAQAWWRANRRAARNALREELLEARGLLSFAPLSGQVAEEHGESVRRMLLPTTRYHLYYTVDEVAAVVRVVLLWHASREAPEL